MKGEAAARAIAEEIVRPGIERVCVAVPTYRRPEQLAALLQHLARQQIDTGKYEPRFVVIDNDERPTARPAVDTAKAIFRHPLEYVHVPEPGLAAVRNAALSYSAGESDFLAMIDDDEVPEPGWLAELLRVRERTDADAVVGPVPASLPPGTPVWVTRGRFFERPRFEEGAVLDNGYTGNCLLALARISSLRLRFDRAFNLSGGEDCLFFRQMIASGGKLVYADRAVATESVPLARTSLRYLAVRAFRNGNTHSLCDLKIDPTVRTISIRILKALRLATLSLCLLPPRIAALGRAGAARSVCDVSRAIGMVAGLAGYRFLEYARAPEAAQEG